MVKRSSWIKLVLFILTLILMPFCYCTATRALLRGEGGRGGEGWGGEGRGGGEGGRGGRERRDECYTYSNGPQYLNSSYVTYYIITCQSAFEYNNDVTYYVITCKSPFDWVYTEQWYVIITSDVTWTE